MYSNISPKKLGTLMKKKFLLKVASAAAILTAQSALATVDKDIQADKEETLLMESTVASSSVMVAGHSSHSSHASHGSHGSHSSHSSGY